LYSSYTMLSCSWSELSTKRIRICIFSSSGKYRLIHLFLFCFWIGQFVKILTQNTHIWEFSYLSTSFSLVPKSDWYLIFNLDYCDKTFKKLKWQIKNYQDKILDKWIVFPAIFTVSVRKLLAALSKALSKLFSLYTPIAGHDWK